MSLAMAVAIYFIVYATGGTATAYPHLMYLPIILSSFLGNWQTAIAVAAVAGLLLSQWLMPLSVADGTVQAFASWSFRLLMFLMVAVWTKSLAGLVQRRQEAERRQNQQILDFQYASLTALINLAETRDPETTGVHMQRMQEYAWYLLEKLPVVEPEDRWLMASAVAFHDIGKVAIPDRILLKEDPLTDEEWDLMKQHPIIGAKVLDDIFSQAMKSRALDKTVMNYISTARDIILYHHERADGNGYPHGLKGHEIPISAQVTAMCDVYDALRAPRPYKEGSSHEEAVRSIRHSVGTHFTTQLVDAFMRAEAGFRRAYERHPNST